MKRSHVAIIASCATLLLLYSKKEDWFGGQHNDDDREYAVSTTEGPVVSTSDGGAVRAASTPHAKADGPGQNIIQSYGKNDTPPERDLFALADLFHFWKGYHGSLPSGGNRLITASLCDGEGYAPLLDKSSPWINSEGEFIDRWGTPIFFHDISRNRIDIVIAGPDKKLGTEDDLKMINGRIESMSNPSYAVKTKSIIHPEYPADRYDSAGL